MKRIVPILAVFLVSATVAVAGSAPTIQGNYIESRSCDVYVAACFANGEVGLLGHEAVMAWDVTEGSWEGVALDGLKVMAVVHASATLGDTSYSPYPAKAVLILDEKANDEQKAALTSLAKELGGRLVEDIVRIEETAIEFARVDACSGTNCASVKAKGLVEITARCLRETDKHCGNEAAFYPPLTDVSNAMLHATVRDEFTGAGLGVTWDSGGRNNAYIAHFAR